MGINENLIVGLVEGGLIAGSLSGIIAYYVGKKKTIENYEEELEDLKSKNFYSKVKIDILENNIDKLYDISGIHGEKIRIQEKRIKDLESKTKSK